MNLFGSLNWVAQRFSASYKSWWSSLMLMPGAPNAKFCRPLSQELILLATHEAMLNKTANPRHLAIVAEDPVPRAGNLLVWSKCAMYVFCMCISVSLRRKWSVG